MKQYNQPNHMIYRTHGPWVELLLTDQSTMIRWRKDKDVLVEARSGGAYSIRKFIEFVANGQVRWRIDRNPHGIYHILGQKVILARTPHGLWMAPIKQYSEYVELNGEKVLFGVIHIITVFPYKRYEYLLPEND